MKMFPSLKDISGFVKDVAMIPAEMYVLIESRVSTKGLVVVIWTATICYLMAVGGSIPQGFGDLYSIIIGAYFGVAAVNKLRNP